VEYYFGIMANEKPLCPDCGSVNVYYRKTYDNWRCNRCGYANFTTIEEDNKEPIPIPVCPECGSEDVYIRMSTLGVNRCNSCGLRDFELVEEDNENRNDSSETLLNKLETLTANVVGGGCLIIFWIGVVCFIIWLLVSPCSNWNSWLPWKEDCPEPEQPIYNPVNPDPVDLHYGFDGYDYYEGYQEGYEDGKYGDDSKYGY
tara:strand:+ start:69 stop:671 length:603 start_codon:yes stop_codon:yes gene_type:complete